MLTGVQKWMTLEFIVFAVVLIGLISLNVWYMTSQVNHSQQSFCAVVSTRANVPPPAPNRHPSKKYLDYRQKVTGEYQALKEKLGC